MASSIHNLQSRAEWLAKGHIAAGKTNATDLVEQANRAVAEARQRLGAIDIAADGAAPSTATLLQNSCVAGAMAAAPGVLLGDLRLAAGAALLTVGGFFFLGRTLEAVFATTGFERDEPRFGAYWGGGVLGAVAGGVVIAVSQFPNLGAILASLAGAGFAVFVGAAALALVRSYARPILQRWQHHVDSRAWKTAENALEQAEAVQEFAVQKRAGLLEEHGEKTAKGLG